MMAFCVTNCTSKRENNQLHASLQSSRDLIQEILLKAETSGMFEVFHDEIMKELQENPFCAEMVQRLGDAALEFYGERRGNTEIERLEMVLDFQKHILENGFLMELTQEFISTVMEAKIEILQGKVYDCAVNVLELKESDISAEGVDESAEKHDRKLECADEMQITAVNAEEHFDPDDSVLKKASEEKIQPDENEVEINADSLEEMPDLNNVEQQESAKENIEHEENKEEYQQSYPKKDLLNGSYAIAEVY